MITPMMLKSDKCVRDRANTAMLLRASHPGTFPSLYFNSSGIQSKNSGDNVHSASRATLTKGCFSKKAYYLFMPSMNSQTLLQLISKLHYFFVLTKVSIRIQPHCHTRDEFTRIVNKYFSSEQDTVHFLRQTEIWKHSYLEECLLAFSRELKEQQKQGSSFEVGC